MQMQKPLDDLLCRRYPALYSARNDDARTTAMCWGFQVGDGWFGIIDALSETLVALAAADGRPCPVAQQVKQKFGRLRFHLEADEDYRNALDLAEEMSRRICEVTGCPGRLCTVDRRGLATLAPGVTLSRKGVDRDVSTVTANLDPITGRVDVPPLTFTLEEMLKWRGDVLAGPVEIPAGWLDTADAVLHVVQRGADKFGPSRISRIWDKGSALGLDWTKHNEGSRVLSEMAATLSSGIDRASGALI